jgi:ATP-dependent helicase/nuclease subunit A
MSETKWTVEQLEAITESGCNLLVAAAAGAGKTAVLVERIIRRITDDKNPADIDRLLVVTFTNAAASEMRERIVAALEKALDAGPHSSRLQRQLSLINKANITTMHSFCLDIIRNNFHRIDLDPVFRVAEETEALLMKTEALEELFEERYEQADSDDVFLRLVECYGGKKDDRGLQQMVLELYEFVQSHPWPDRWLTEKTESFNLSEDGDFGSSGWAKILAESVRIELEGLRDMMTGAVRTIKADPGLEPYLDTFLQDIKNIEQLAGLCEGGWEALHNAFRELRFDTLPRCGSDADRDAKEKVAGIRNKTKERIRKIADEIFGIPPDGIVRDMRDMYPLLKGLSGLVIDFEAVYSAKKREKSVLDFNDLEHFCLEILTEEDDGGRFVPSGTALFYRDRFDEILVDEYQDSNLVQEVIINTISGDGDKNPRVFVVGDVKQSIYRFRQARPELFMSKYDSFPSKTGFSNRKILLYKNFRSRQNIIDAVNMVFGHIMSRTVGELDYTSDEALNHGAVYPAPEDERESVGGPVELHIIDREDGEAHKEQHREKTGDIEQPGTAEEEEPDAMQSEAILISDRIRQLVDPPDQSPFRVYDGRRGGYRNVEYRDIVVLLRATKGWAETFVEEFRLAGIPVYADISTGYFRTVEIQVMMSLLKIIDNPMQDIPMLSVLRSPIGAFTPEELIDIRLCDREVPFYQAMKEAAKDGKGGNGAKTAAKVRDFIVRLESWRDRAVHMSTDELIWHLFADTGYYSYTGTMPGGIQKQANLRMLYERARQYEETSYRGLFNFINFMDRIRSGSGDLGSARVLGENENVVRIMSIHKSKGLEFPVVILAGCGKGFNFRDTTRKLLVHQDLGFGPEYMDPDRRISYPTLAKQALKFKTRLETLSEEMRILYVAFTRAREKLIITGSVRNLEKKMVQWQNGSNNNGSMLSKYQAMTAASFLDWLCPVLSFHPDSSEPGGLWDINIWNRGGLLRDDVAAAGQAVLKAGDIRKLLDSIGPGEYCEEIAKRLEWKYRYERSAELPVKLSVTELKRRADAEFAEEYTPLEAYPSPAAAKPAFMDESKGFSAAEKGSILHFVMQHLDLAGPLDREGISAQVESMVSRELITMQEAQVVDTAALERFFGSPLGRRMLKSTRVMREVPFNIEITSTDVYRELAPDIYGGENIILQGVIDCCFEEDGKMILVDYKTDRYGVCDSVPGIDGIKEKYRSQIEYYAAALRRITGKPVGGKYLYLFHGGHIVEY